jgi:hypothetical protein
MRPLTYEDLRAVESVFDEMYDTVEYWQAQNDFPAHAETLYELTQKMRLYIAPDSSSSGEIHECEWCGSPTKYPTDRNGRGVCIACSVTAK